MPYGEGFKTLMIVDREEDQLVAFLKLGSEVLRFAIDFCNSDAPC